VQTYWLLIGDKCEKLVVMVYITAWGFCTPKWGVLRNSHFSVGVLHIRVRRFAHMK
jgi:hypothetical protein